MSRDYNFCVAIPLNSEEYSVIDDLLDEIEVRYDIDLFLLQDYFCVSFWYDNSNNHECPEGFFNMELFNNALVIINKIINELNLSSSLEFVLLCDDTIIWSPIVLFLSYPSFNGDAELKEKFQKAKSLDIDYIESMNQIKGTLKNYKYKYHSFGYVSQFSLYYGTRYYSRNNTKTDLREELVLFTRVNSGMEIPQFSNLLERYTSLFQKITNLMSNEVNSAYTERFALFSDIPGEHIELPVFTTKDQILPDKISVDQDYFQGKNDLESDLRVLKELEAKLGIKIPSYEKTKGLRFHLIENGRITSLCIHDQNIPTIPDEIRFLTALKELALQDDKITLLPEWIGELQCLQHLDLGNNKIRAITESIGKLNSLIWLSLKNNNLRSVPSSLFSLNSLKMLSLSYNKLETLPDITENSFGPERLFLDNNLLSSLPDSFGRLKRLKEIFLDKNKFIKLPKAICGLDNLQLLRIWYNPLQFIPECFSNLKNLKELSLRRCLLESIPNGILNSSSLENVDLQSNQIQTVSKNIKNMQNVVELNLNYNQIREIPSTINELKCLKRLYLAYNPLEIIPKEVALILELEELDIKTPDKLIIPVELKTHQSLKKLTFNKENISFE